MKGLGWVVALVLFAACNAGEDHKPARPPGGGRGAQQERDGSVRDAGDRDASPLVNLDAGKPPLAPVRAQVFSRTLGFRHDSIAAAQAALKTIAARRPVTFAFTEDPAQLTDALPDSDVVVFLMTTGDVLDANQQTKLEAFIRGGGGYVGVHSAADTEYDWPFYGELAGAWFKDHPAIQPAKVVVEATDDPRVSFLPANWMRTDEWYNFRENPRARVTVLLRLDESSYSGGTMGGDHPIAWSHSIDKGRAFYTGFGHTEESWQDPLVVQHVEKALFWAAGR